jgi:hypothetical protein
MGAGLAGGQTASVLRHAGPIAVDYYFLLNSIGSKEVDKLDCHPNRICLGRKNWTAPTRNVCFFSAGTIGSGDLCYRSDLLTFFSFLRLFDQI